MTIELKTQRDVEVWNAAWNAAIEKAAGVIDQCNSEGPYEAIGGARRIRYLLLKYPDTVGKRDYSTELDKVIEDEMKHKPKDIMK